jgi:hypothetical protein
MTSIRALASGTSVAKCLAGRLAMRATTVLAGAVLAMAIAAPREARSAGIARQSGGAMVLSVAAGIRTAGAVARFQDVKAVLNLTRVATSHAVQAVFDAPQLALGIVRSSSSMQLTVEPTYAKMGRSRSPGLALSGRF